MEEAVGARRDGFVAIDAAGADDADGRLLLLHHAALHAGSVGAKDDVGMALDEECVLHVTCRVVVGKVHRAKHVPVVFHLRTIGEGEAHATEDVDEFLLDEREGVACAERDGVGRSGEVEVAVVFLSGGQLCFEFVEAGLQGVFEFVDAHAYFAFLLRSHVAEVSHELIDQALLTEVFQSKCFELFFVLSDEFGHFGENVVDFANHILMANIKRFVRGLIQFQHG